MSNPTKTIVQIVHLDETGDSYHRMRWPASALATQRPDWRVLNFHWSAAERYEVALGADLLVLFQCSDPFMLNVIRQRKAKGLKTLVEYNDNFYAPCPASPVAKEWSSPELWQTYESFLQLADGVIVTDTGLKDLFTEVTSSPIHILKNHFHHPIKSFDQLWESKPQQLTIGWAGSLGHFSDLIAHRDVFHWIVESFEDVQLSFMGNPEIFQSLHLPRKRYKVIPWASMQQYYAFLEKVHIGIAPLLDTPYNRCRSDIKAIEMAACGVLPLLSEIGPYCNLTRLKSFQGFKDQDELYQFIVSYIEDEKLLKTAAAKSHSYIEKHRLGTKNEERQQLYNDYMTESSSNLNLKLPAGYFELRGTREDVSLSERVQKDAAKLIKDKQRDNAIQLLLRHRVDRNIELSAARLLLRSDRARGIALLEQGMKRYTRDMRYMLMLLEFAPSDDMREVLWSEVVRVLEDVPKEVRRHYAKSIIALFEKQSQKSSISQDILLKLLAFYPDSLQLKHRVALIHEVEGRLDEAREVFEEVIAEIDRLNLNGDIKLRREYAVAWYDGLADAVLKE